jgi:hypothetical protein
MFIELPLCFPLQSGPSGQLNSKTVGVNYRALDLLFALREERSAEWDFDIGVEMVEVSNKH